MDFFGDKKKLYYGLKGKNEIDDDDDDVCVFDKVIK